MSERLPTLCRDLKVVGRHATISSIDVARRFRRRHDHLLRDIEKLRENSPNLGRSQWFLQTEYVARQGARHPAFDMTRSGFVLLVMGFTGAHALQFKVAYIEAFDAMEDALLRGGLGRRPSFARVKQNGRQAFYDARDRIKTEENRKITEPEISAAIRVYLWDHPDAQATIIDWVTHKKFWHETVRDAVADDPRQGEFFWIKRDRNDTPVHPSQMTRLEVIETGRRIKRTIAGFTRRFGVLLGLYNETHPGEVVAEGECEVSE